MPKLQRVFFKPDQFHEDEVICSPEQTRYLVKVLRLRTDDQFIVMNGKGHWWRASLMTDGSSAQLIDQMQVNHELPIDIVLAAAPSKGKGFEEVVHGATELGVRHIYPLLSARTQMNPSDKKIDRWQKIAIEASEQSLRQFVPMVHRPVTLEGLGQTLARHDDVSIFFCSTQPQRKPLTQALQSFEFNSVALLTGPEGGWSPQEESLFDQMDWMGVSLGQRILRAVTAPICALSLIASHAEWMASK